MSILLPRWRQLLTSKPALHRRLNGALHSGIVKAPVYRTMPLRRLQSIDLVEDSEPEREALRETIKSTKRPAKRPLSKAVIKSNDVIDISSSDEAPPKFASTVVIDLSDSPSTSRASSSRDNAIDDTNDPSVPSTTQPEPSSNLAQVPNKFSHFSYAAPPSRRTSINLQKEPAKPTSVQPKRKQTKKPTHRFADDFSNAQLSKITKCIACKLKWTTTKTAAEKMTHILSCAAKHSFADETIRILIREELRLNANKDAEQLSTAESETYFEDVVKTIAPKKRGRRQKATETIQEVDKESRKRILDKARSIIGSAKSRSVSESPDREECHDPLTQNFGQSSLGERFRGPTLAFSTGLSQPLASTSFGSGDESEVEFPPTQALGPSKFAQRVGANSLVQASTGEVLGESNHPFASNILQDVRDLSPPLSLSSLPSPPVHEYPALNSEQDGDSEINSEADDCFLYYEPGSAGGLAEDNDIPRTLNDTPRRPRGRPRSPKTATPSSKAKSPTKAKKDKVVKQTKGKQKAGSSALDSMESEHEWEEMMRGLISKDEELYSRIIRYEPIHFDIFLNMAGITGRCPTKMRTKLRSFLDKQAVHFYGSEPRQRGQRRRSRSKSKSRS